MKILREWENSKDITNIYLLITRNRKTIKDKVNQVLIGQGKKVQVHSDNLIAVLKDCVQDIKMSNTQWKILVSIADKEKNSFIDFDLFMRLIENSAKQYSSHPKINKV